MLTHRVIPCLLLKNGGVVKTVKFKDAKYVGDPINAVRIFNQKEVDELMILDICATKERRGPDFALIEQLASECFMPLCYGGGIRSLEDAKQLFGLGIEKVCLQSIVFQNPFIIREIADHYGEQAVVVSIDVRKSIFGKNVLFSHAKVSSPFSNWRMALESAVRSGAGEVLLNAVDKDGTRLGMDLDLIREASAAVNVPLIAIGGVGSLADIRSATDAGASAVAAGSYFVFQGPHRAVLITYPLSKDLLKLWQ